MMYWNGYGNGYDAWGWIFGLLWFLLIVLLIVLAIRFFSHKGYHAGHGETPVEILKKRYASGEIDKKEYQEKLKDLKE